MTQVDLVDVLLQVLPRAVGRVLILIVLAVFGSSAVSWYAEQKAEVIQEQVVAPMLERITARLPVAPTGDAVPTNLGEP